MKHTHHQTVHLPVSVYVVFVAAILSNALVTFIMLKYFL
jgi:hypothetical protein